MFLLNHLFCYNTSIFIILAYKTSYLGISFEYSISNVIKILLILERRLHNILVYDIHVQLYNMGCHIIPAKTLNHITAFTCKTVILYMSCPLLIKLITKCTCSNRSKKKPDRRPRSHMYSSIRVKEFQFTAH